MFEVFSTIGKEFFNLSYDFSGILSGMAQFFKLWWWVFPPLILFWPAKYFHLWWRHWEVWLKQQKWVFLEVKPPKEIVKPIKAMEHVFQSLWAPIFDQKNLVEKWINGEMEMFLGLSFEIVSLGGEVHFYICCLERWRTLIESAIYSQYPDAEILETQDYTQFLPQDIPNREWDFYGLDLQFLKEDYYPILTYSTFFEERGESIKEEKRIDPLSQLIERLSTLKPGEQYWFQIIIRPVSPAENPWVKRAKEKVEKIAGRKREVKYPLFGPLPEKKEEIWPPALKLTPGEEEIVRGIENKIKKNGFETSIRGIYLAKREVFNPANRYIAEGYGSEFGTQNLNAFKKWGKTKTAALGKFWFGQRRLFVKKRKMFRNYVKRLPSFFPKNPGKGCFILNPEELATIYHFAERAPATIPTRVEARKGEPPLYLPTE